MTSLAKSLALAAVGVTIAVGTGATSAEAKGFHRGHGFAHKLGGHHFGLAFGQHDCWRFGKFVCKRGW